MPLQTLSRRGLLGLLALGAAGLVAGCSGRVPSLSEPGDADLALGGRAEALDLVLGRLRGAYGEGFGALLEEGEHVGGDGVRRWSWLLAPEAAPDLVFSATVHVEAGTGRLLRGPLSSYSQYLFKERVEGPLLDLLAGLDGVAGYAATLTDVRYDSRVWLEGELDEYMGGDGRGDPGLSVLVMLPRDGDLDSWARTARPCYEEIYAVERNVRLYVGVEGADPFRNPLSPPDAESIYASTRKDPPSQEKLREKFKRIYLFPDSTVYWDGDGAGDGIPHDPAEKFYLPHITWNPGYGPEHW